MKTKEMINLLSDILKIVEDIKTNVINLESMFIKRDEKLMTEIKILKKQIQPMIKAFNKAPEITAKTDEQLWQEEQEKELKAIDYLYAE